jgi:hypothetical protein
MHDKTNRAVLATAASLLIIAAGGCTSSSVAPSSPARTSTTQLEQPGTTDYMRSRVGTPDELSPLAPAEARNVHKAGKQWICEINGRIMVYNEASARWEPQQ